jgi:hypothetical protein
MNTTETLSRGTDGTKTERRRRLQRRREFDRAVRLDTGSDIRRFPGDPAGYRFIHCCAWQRENPN